MTGALIRWGFEERSGGVWLIHPKLGILIRERDNLLIPLCRMDKSDLTEERDAQCKFNEEYWKRLGNSYYEFVGSVEVPEDLVVATQKMIEAKNEFCQQLDKLRSATNNGEFAVTKKLNLRA